MPVKTFESNLRELLNIHSMENCSNTPDIVLAKFLTDCLDAYNKATIKRQELQSTGNEPTTFTLEGGRQITI